MRYSPTSAPRSRRGALRTPSPRAAVLAVAALAAVVALAALAAGSARDAEPPPAPAPAPAPRPARPVVVLLRHTPWGAADDRPLFVLYDDGRVLVPRWVDGVVQSYRVGRLDVGDRDAALARLGIGPDLFALPAAHALDPDAPGQEALVLCVWRGDTVTRVAVGIPPVGPPVGRASLPEETPRAFRDAYRALTAFRPDGAVEWRPSHVEVVARPYEYAPDGPPLDWPRGWPGLAGAARRVEHGAADTLWTIALPYERLPDLRRLLGRRRTRQAIRIDARKVAVRWRVSFPGEALWRAQLPHVEP